VVGGTLNGKPFTTIEDADPRIGARLELFAAGQYSWMPFEHIATVRMEAPKRLRDLLWLPAIVRPGETFTGLEMGEVLLPNIAAESWQYDDGDVRLGRVTEWTKLNDGAHAPIGQKLLLVDGEEFPMVELRELEIVRAPATLA
jgi:type VI secretion system protein ImpE